MFGERAVSIYELSDLELREMLEDVQAGGAFAHKIEDHVKIFARLNDASEISYARGTSDLGTCSTARWQICERLSPTIQEEVSIALLSFESVMLDRWPFLPGSYSWIEVQVKIASRTLEIKRAVSISSAGRGSMKTSRVQKKVLRESLWGFQECCDGWSTIYHPGQEIVCLPQATLDGFVSGQIASSEITDEFIEINSLTNEFYMLTDHEKIVFDKTRSRKVVGVSSSELPPPPIAGFLN